MTAARPATCIAARRSATASQELRRLALWSCSGARGPLVKKFVNPPRRLGADAFDLNQVSHRSALDRFQSAEVMQQCALARRPDTGNLLQPGLAQILGPPRTVRADGEAMGLIAQPLDEIEHRIARRQLERVAAGKKEGFAASVAVRPLADGNQRHIGAELLQHLARGVELAEAAVDQDEVR